MSQVLEVLTLQGLDDEAAALRAALADVERRLQGDEELLDARRRLVAAETTAQAIQQRQRRLEDEVESLSDKISREDTRLYDGAVKSARELSSLQQEVEHLKENRGKLEDELIAVLDEAEAADRERRDAIRLVGQLEERWEQVSQELRREGRRLTDAIARADARREIQKTNITPRALHLYEDLRRRKGGMAVARISAGTCQGCRVSIPDAIRRKALSPVDLAQCPNCERILAVG
ncbi:MAG: zinc ribbon domain-containing protein [Hyphomicrobiales bacterium]